MIYPENASRSLRRPLVRRVVLSDFRSYPKLDLALRGRLVVLCGENGAGKTNLLEALSLFSPGRGLRRAELSECARRSGAGGFAISIEVEEDGASHQLGSGWKPAAGGDDAERTSWRDISRHFLVNFDLTSEIWRGIGAAALPRGDIMRYQ